MLITRTIILCIIMMLMTLSKHSGFILIFWLLFLAPFILKDLYIVLVKKRNQKQKLIQMALWSISCLIVIGFHVYLHQTARQYANTISEAVNAYYLSNHEYPETLEQIGINKTIIDKNHVYYHNDKDDSQPFLFYPTTWTLFDIYYYDFKNQQWVFRGD